MDYMNYFLANYGAIVGTSVFWVLIVFVITRKTMLLQVELDDMTEMNRYNIEVVSDMREKAKSDREACAASRNENLALKRENQKLRDMISKKKEFRLRNGKWCTEEQYLDEKNGVGIPEMFAGLDELAAGTHDAIAAVDANEEANKKIEEFLQTDKK